MFTLMCQIFSFFFGVYVEFYNLFSRSGDVKKTFFEPKNNFLAKLSVKLNYCSTLV
jgi:hypothetical protein